MDAPPPSRLRSDLPLVLSALALAVATAALARTFAPPRPAPGAASACPPVAAGAPVRRSTDGPAVARPAPDARSAEEPSRPEGDLLPNAEPMRLDRQVTPIAPAGSSGTPSVAR